MQLSNKMTYLSSAIFSKLDDEKKALIAKGIEPIDFSIGTPDAAPAPWVMELLSKACLVPENYHYAISDSSELISAVQTWYHNRYHVDLQNSEITSLLGSQSGFLELALCLVSPGDVVLVPSPCYPIFKMAPLIAGAKVHTMPLLKEKDYLIDFNAIPEALAQKAKWMIVSYPNNPTTATAPLHFYEELVAFAKKYDIIVLHDNAYSELSFDETLGQSFLSIPGAKEVGVEFNSLSKTYNVPGCRIAFAIGNETIIGALKTLKSHTDYGMFLPLQKVACALLEGSQEDVPSVRERYLKRGQFLKEGFEQLGLHMDAPKGTMFAWVPIPSHYTSSLAFTYDLIKKAHVIVVPGISFGEEGEGYVRLALVQDEAMMAKALSQIAESGILKA